jgi:mono/diheme cytochrome c family protein
MVFRTLMSATALFLAMVTPAALAADGAEVFKTQCSKCHGEDGRGETPAGKMLKVPSLAGKATIAGASQADVVKRIEENPKHGALKGKLSPEDLAAAAGRVKELAGAKP